MSHYQRIFDTVKKSPDMFIRACIQSVVWTFFDIYIIWLFQKIATLVQQDTTGQQILYYIYQFTAVLIFYYVWKFFTRDFGWAQMNYRQPMITWKKYFPKFAHLAPTYVEKIGTGKVMNIMKDGVDSWKEILLELSARVLDIIIKFIFSIWLIYQIGPLYALCFIVAFIMLHIVVLYLNTFAIVRRRKRKEAETVIARQLVRMIMSKQEILQNSKVSHEVSILDKLSEEAHSVNLKVNTHLRGMFNIPLLLTHLVVLVTLIYAFVTIRSGDFSFGLFSGFVALSGFLTSSVLNSTSAIKNLTQAFTHVEKMWDFIDNAPELKNYALGEKFAVATGHIRLQHVNFSYEKSNVFTDFSLEIIGGKKTALVGMSGAGKSTIIKMIAGYIMPDSGTLLVDEQDLHTISLKSYYKHIGYLTQEPSVFDGTIYENLVYALDYTPTQEALDEAIQQAQCQFVYQFPDGLQTEIGEKGIRLSGGQRQRLAIAKIFLKNPQIVLLDEPTSALDSLSEEAITKALDNLFAGRTVVIVAHRLQTVKKADDIIVLEEGNIIERGTHDELVARGGQYAKMLELQSGF